MQRKPRIAPICNVVYVNETEVKEIVTKDILADVIGVKAYGLTCLPKEWTLPFFVISADLFEDYRKTGCISERWFSLIKSAIIRVKIPDGKVILRSSSVNETMQERGNLISEQADLCSLPDQLQDYCKQLMGIDLEKEARIPIIVQEYVEPAVWKGHMSNERRMSKENRDWHVEYDIAYNDIPNSAKLPVCSQPMIHLRNWRRQINVVPYLSCMLLCFQQKAEDILPVVATWGTGFRERLHFEWVHDGTYVYIVQVDAEIDRCGTNPTKIADPNTKRIDEKLQCLHLITKADRDRFAEYNKVQCPLVYADLDLPTVPLYVLDNEEVILSLSNGVVPVELENDLKILTKHSLVIRVDVNSSEKELRQMQARTDEIRSYAQACDWLISESRKVVTQDSYKYIFIFHNFVPAVSAAFAYAKPNDSVVLIEALWGIPDGLYYYAHDKYVVDTKETNIEKMCEDKFDITEHIQYKNYFLAPLITGEWRIATVAVPYDWRSSISQESWKREIAKSSRLIANYYNQSVSVMWFVGVNNRDFGSCVIPWHLEPYDYQQVPTQITKKRFSTDKIKVISTISDLEECEQYEKSEGRVLRIQLLPKELELIRNKDIILRIGAVAKKLDAVIDLEGGVLSHAYYQLVKTGAKIEVASEFYFPETTKSFSKLVRDKIPQRIEAGGEKAVVEAQTPDLILLLLKQKLVEESLEVADAVESEDITEELADVQEVCDSIMQRAGITKNEVAYAQEHKRNKSGGFQDGKVLVRTENNSDIQKIFDNKYKARKRDGFSKWSDRKQFSDGVVSITKARIPISLAEWNLQIPHKSADGDTNATILVSAHRDKGDLIIEVQACEKTMQLRLDMDKGTN